MILAVLPIRYADFIATPNAQELISEYAAECSIDAIGHPEPQAEMYADMEEVGLMRGFAAYANDQLIGFAVVLVSVLPHYGRKVATVESLFISKGFRATRAGTELLKHLETYAGARGCIAVLYSAPAGGAFEALMSNRKDCQRTNSVFCRRIA